MSPRAQHHAPENLLGLNGRITLLPRISASQEAIAREVGKDQAMGPQPVHSLRNHNIAHPQPRGRNAFHAQSLTVSYER
jgi:hypothetical protein